MIKERPQYRAIYQMELAISVTGKTEDAIRKTMERKNLNLSDTIRYYLESDKEKAFKYDELCK